jgi:hypothetical protein
MKKGVACDALFAGVLFRCPGLVCDKSRMGRPRRVLAWMAIVGLAITVVVMLQRRGAVPAAAEAGATALPSLIAAGATQWEMPTAGSAPPPTAGMNAEPPAKCTQVISAAARFAALERNAPVEDQETDQAEGEMLAELATARRNLSASDDPEDFLAALLLEIPGRQASEDVVAGTKLADLADLAAQSGSKLLAWHALRACADAKPSCPVAHLEQRLLEVDSQNAEAWALVATLRYKRRDFAGAFAAMQGAARAPTSTWYWTETVALVERALAAHSAMPYPARMSNAFGSTAAMAMPRQTELVAMCRTEAVASRAWGEACLAFGELRAQRNETDAARSIAHLIRERALTALGDPGRAAEVAAELAVERARRSLMGSEPESSMVRLQWELIQAGPAQLQSYLGAFREFGETAGVRMYLRQQVPALLERAALLDGDGARECAARLFAEPTAAPAHQPVRIDDQLHIDMRDRSGSGGQRTVRIRADGKITLPFVRQKKISGAPREETDREIMVAGKTVDQLQREITTILSGYQQSPQVRVILFSPPPEEELRREFDNARREATSRRSESR